MYGRHTYKPNGLWNHAADLMIINFRESGHPLFRETSAFCRGALKNKGGGITSRHCNADPAMAELLFRMIISVNQLSVCEEFAQQIPDHSSTGTGNPVAKVNNESASKVASTVVSILTNSLGSMCQLEETRCGNTGQYFVTIHE